MSKWLSGVTHNLSCARLYHLGVDHIVHESCDNESCDNESCDNGTDIVKGLTLTETQLTGPITHTGVTLITEIETINYSTISTTQDDASLVAILRKAQLGISLVKHNLLSYFFK